MRVSAHIPVDGDAATFAAFFYFLATPPAEWKTICSSPLYNALPVFFEYVPVMGICNWLHKF
jgi:hypothetical protein